MELRARDLTSDDLDAAFAVRTRSFGRSDPSVRGWWEGLERELMEQRRTLGVFDGDRLVGQAKIRPFEQYWGGRSVPMAGVAGVVVSPEYRGVGVASLLMRALAHRGVELGDAISALYPATLAPYRRTGWELAGAQTRVTVDARLLRGLSTSGRRVRQATTDDTRWMRDVLATRYTAERAHGPKLLTEDEMREAVTDESSFSYVTDDGFVLYEWQGSDLFVTCLVAATEESARALWAVVGSGSSVAKRVHAYVGPGDPVHLLLPEEVTAEPRVHRWMLRVLDPVHAIAARGFPAYVTGTTAVTLADPLLPGNDGTWRLEVSHGRADLSRTAEQPGSLLLGPGGLAAMYAGTPLHLLRATGRAHGGSDEDDRFLDAAFTGPAAYLLEYF